MLRTRLIVMAQRVSPPFIQTVQIVFCSIIQILDRNRSRSKERVKKIRRSKSPRDKSKKRSRSRDRVRHEDNEEGDASHKYDNENGDEVEANGSNGDLDGKNEPVPAY